MLDTVMKVIKRSGESEDVSFDKVLQRMKNLCVGFGKPALDVDVYDISQKVCARIYNNVATSELDELAAQICSSMIVNHPDYGELASRIIVSNHHKNTSPSFSEAMTLLYTHTDVDGEPCPLIDKQVYDVICKHKEKLNSYMDYKRDYEFDYFGFKTLERAYLMKLNGKIVERPQHMFMRVALGVHGSDIKDALQMYDLMSKKYYIHATPTLFNSGTRRPQLSSCFLLSSEDSIDGIYDTLKECANISKYAGGIGMHIHSIRAKRSKIRGTNGNSTGIIPMLRVFNNTARYVNQCMTPDVTVYSKKGVVRMDDVRIGDELVTIDGTYKKVNSISINNVDKDILKIRTTYSTDPIQVTKEHEMYVVPGQSKSLNLDVIKNHVEKGIAKPHFVCAKDVTVDDLVGYPIPNTTEDIVEDNDFCRFYGIMISDGYIHHNANTEFNNYEIAVNTKTETFTFLCGYLKKCNITYCVNSNETKPDEVYIRWAMDQTNLPMSHQDIYKTNSLDSQKHIHPRFLNLPREKALALIHGLLETGSSDSKQLYFHTTSKDVVNSLRYILLRLGVLTSGKVHDAIDNKNKGCYILCIPKHVNLVTELTFEPCQDVEFFEHDNIIWSRISEIEEVKYTGPVYDFNMMDNHNYTLANFGLVHNSGKRNGSIAVYLEPWHADVEGFLDLRKPHGHEEERTRDLFLALWIPDLFMRRVQENKVWSLMCPDVCKGLADVYGEEFDRLYEEYEAAGKFVKQIPAQKIWFKILESQIESGQPYMLYKDASNTKSNQKNLGTIKSSNLCVAPETPILTTEGYVPIKELHGKRVRVWNGHEFSETVIHQTGRMQKLMKVGFCNGMTLRCTPYHKFYIEVGARPGTRSYVKEIEAKDLKTGMKIVSHNLPTIRNFTATMKFPYTHGLFCAEGTYSNQYDPKPFSTRLDNGTKCSDHSKEAFPIIRLYGAKKDLVQHIDSVYSLPGTNDSLTVGLHNDIADKFFVPINYSLETKVQWLAGLVDGGGIVVENNGVKNIQIASINKEFLQNVLLMLQTMGISTKVGVEIKRKQYTCKKLYKLNIDAYSVCHLIDLGFAPKRLDVNVCRMAHHETIPFIKVNMIDVSEDFDDTYCFNEPKRHAGMFNGVLTSQCTEIIEYTDKDETAVCNLASIALPSFVSPGDDGKAPIIDHAKLHEVAKIATKNLNKVIDVTFYPVEKARRSNLRHRPIGIGVQGLADMFVLMKVPFDSPEAAAMNRDVFETIYHGALEASMEIAKKRHEFSEEYKTCNDDQRKVELSEYLKRNEFDPDPFTSKYPGAYVSYDGCPASKGILQFDMWGVTPSDRYDWSALKQDIIKYGLRNSLLLAPMPTASTSQILGFNECIEPFTSNMYKRKTLAGEFIIINKYLIKELIQTGIWSKELKDRIILQDGSIQDIPEIPQNIRDMFKTVWEMKQKTMIDMASERAAYICQSQSLNLFMEDPDFKKLSSMHFYAWSKGLKTGLYYLRSKPKAQAQKFTIDPSMNKLTNLKPQKTVVCTDEVCTVCSS